MLMDSPAPNYHREFFKSPHHAALVLLTLGLGFLSAQLLGLILGVTGYVLGWIYLPDLPFFRRWVDRRDEGSKRAEEARKVAEFVQRRDALLRSLSPQRRERYARLTQVCRDIETASADNLLASADPATDPRLRKLDELMWTYLRLLGIEESLEQFLETERREDVPSLVKVAEAEAAKLSGEIDALKAKGGDATLETKQRYLGSRLERLEVLRKRQQRSTQAEANLALVVSEQERLDQQIKLIRADAVATKNAETLTARIDATVEHLDQTNKWLSELDEFKDLVGDMPSTELRVGYQATPVVQPPPLIQTQPGPLGRRQSQRQGQAG
jgi:hypothetical protein